MLKDFPRDIMQSSESAAVGDLKVCILLTVFQSVIIYSVWLSLSNFSNTVFITKLFTLLSSLNVYSCMLSFTGKDRVNLIKDFCYRFLLYLFCYPVISCKYCHYVELIGNILVVLSDYGLRYKGECV